MPTLANGVPAPSTNNISPPREWVRVTAPELAKPADTLGMLAAATAWINPATLAVDMVTVYAVVFADVAAGLVVNVNEDPAPGAVGDVKLPIATVGPVTFFLHR